MKRVFIVHRWDGKPSSDWYPWLKKELEKRKFKVFVLKMPNTENPIIKNWVNFLEKSVRKVDDETYFVGHSIGCQTIMRYLEKLPVKSKIGGCIFIAGWFKLDNLEGPEVEKIAKPWLENNINFKNIRNKMGNIKVILSDNDPYGFVNENSQVFKEKLGAKIIIEKAKGHFSEDEGIFKLPIALKSILEISR